MSDSIPKAVKARPETYLPRRAFLYSTASATAGLVLRGRALGQQRRKALIAITLDLEMSRHFPTWNQTHWDYEKGNLDSDTKEYALQAARRVKARGGVIHFFVVGRVLEQEDVGWLREIIAMGHPVGNHTYDHVYVLAKKLEEIQYRFRRAPWLIEGKTPQQVILENIRLTNLALEQRLGIKPVGFRTPGGFVQGLSGRPDVQRMLQSLGFHWVSGKYAQHPVGTLGEEPSPAVYEAIIKTLKESQPFVYPETGLIEIPMSPVSDLTGFRKGRWKLESFLKMTRKAVEWTIENQAVYDFLGHPSCLLVADPKMQVFDLICDLVDQAGERASLVDLETIARRVKT